MHDTQATSTDQTIKSNSYLLQSIKMQLMSAEKKMGMQVYAKLVMTFSAQIYDASLSLSQLWYLDWFQVT